MASRQSGPLPESAPAQNAEIPIVPAGIAATYIEKRRRQSRASFRRWAWWITLALIALLGLVAALLVLTRTGHQEPRQPPTPRRDTSGLWHQQPPRA